MDTKNAKPASALVHINATICPDCECSTVESEGRNNQHCSGEWNEHRRFRCGLELKYTPNFHRVEVAKPCPRSPEQLKVNQQKEVALGKLTAYISRLDLGDDLKEKLTKEANYTLGNRWH